MIEYIEKRGITMNSKANCETYKGDEIVSPVVTQISRAFHLVISEAGITGVTE